MASLLTDELRTRLRHNGDARARGEKIDPYPVVRLFTPDAHACWLLSELAADDDTAYGLVDVGMGSPDLGVVRLSDLRSIRGPRDLPVQRDLFFEAKRPLSEYARLAREDGSIND